MVTLGVSSPALGKYPIQVSSPDGNTKVGIGVNAAGEGVVVLNSKAKSTLGLTGAGIVEAHNAQDKRAFVLGPIAWGGDLHLYNSSGTPVVGIFAEQGQSGIAQLFNAAGQERVTLGTKFPSGKGDVCASGNQAANCLSHMLNPKY